MENGIQFARETAMTTMFILLALLARGLLAKALASLTTSSKSETDRVSIGDGRVMRLARVSRARTRRQP